MKPTYDLLVQGNNLRLKDDFLGMSNVTLIRGKSGPILFDTGGYVSRLGLIKALAARGLRPADIPVVFLSHLHFDHAHNVDLFSHARFIVSRREWDYVENPHPNDLLVPWGIRQQLSKSRVDFIEGEGMLDEGISFFPAPGHTPGCYALELATDDRGTVVIAGDAIKYAKEAIIRACDMAFDTIENGTRTIERILDRADRIMPGHFPELIKQPNGAFSWNDAAPFDLLIR
ncbi:glyoxylase-like metal-dependent hydrolase (beta-lactamase superfamily II) [Rhizobium sp. BK313]|uniref:MBL fold metallo-hydrolase n=1 Tax=Rhizobium sp. BK313 TaxID=2587081 RepID=UPI0010616064|nr:MBL fold metallo-hydrolase [Rhizobium sp. BK313]MBB3458334.1 glyoxylase-like metal-dependent hydrolase (beta-lactamase superfamily II) [Rhizobium sp. BK313]